MSQQIAVQRPSRWDRPFGPDMTDADVERVLEHPLLRAIDESQFPKNQPLRDILRNDGRLQFYHRGDFIMRRGEYGSSAFFILLGRVRVLYDESALGELAAERQVKKRSIVGAISQLWHHGRPPEVRHSASYTARGDIGLRQRGEDPPRPFFNDVEALADISVVRSASGLIGEIAALSRTPRTATVVADGDVVLFELRWQGLRDIRRFDPVVRNQIDALYRERGLVAHLAESPLLSHCDRDTLDAIATQTLFESYGEYDWFRGFKADDAERTDARLDRSAVIVEEGQYLDGLVMIRSGFAQVSRQLDHGQRTVGYRMRNETFGLSEIVRHLQLGTELVAQETISALGYVDVLRMPTHLVEQYILPQLSKSQLAELLEDPPEPAPAWIAAPKGAVLEQSLINFLVDNRYINGTATMVIDTNRCVHCDECVRACATAHENNPRFIRHGVTHLNLMIANACMHCVDPVCLIGCPTGAIHRMTQDGRVVIDDEICIGCATCANACPYNNIRMVEIRDQTGAIMIDEETRNPILKATKCDLCEGQLGGPACQRACPHDALVRVDMRDREPFARWTRR